MGSVALGDWQALASMSDQPGGNASPSGHLACPFCNSYDVNRLYLATAKVDSCECQACSARWDEDARSGEYKGRGASSSVLAKRIR